MVDLLYTELLKLKRAKMFLVSIIGAAAAPLMIFIGYLDRKAKVPDEPVQFADAFTETNLYVVLLIGTLLYGVITAYLFHREYAEDTLKNLLTIPVPRIRLMVSKLLLLFLWMLMLTLFSWSLVLLLGLLAGYEGLSIGVVTDSIQQFLIGGALLFLMTTPTMFVTLLFKNYVPTIIFTAAITMGNVALANSEYRVLFPWSIPHVIATGSFVSQYPAYYSYISIIAVSLLGFAVSAIYFKRADVG
ncbi:ABC transporter permease [Paenibacillus pinihumi]|uniref:ABC transporter permease n=1 Tax=Paenibacillus pinihumi TaxID=669462 RepID=UPI0004133F5C|nr:ABC transporter permease [Paenibacillus pinihumi]